MKKTTAEKKHYTDLVNEALDYPLYKHCSLRTCFDPYSYEWSETDMDAKINILQKVVAKGNSLKNILAEYKITYRTHPASEDAADGLARLLQHLLQNNKVKLNHKK